MKQFDLQGSILFVLGASIGIGLMHQMIGLILQFAVYTKNKDYIGAFAYPGTWILFLTASILKILSSIYTGIAAYGSVIDMLFIFSIVAFIFGQGIRTRPAILIPFVGIAQFFNITGFVSNSLSYARLLALGLATGVIANVINFLAGLFGSTDSLFGILIYVVILILGHSINIGLNLLGTFINVLRLQLVEFFPRFFNASGVELAPVKLISNYFNFSDKMVSTYLSNFSLIIKNYKKKNL